MIISDSEHHRQNRIEQQRKVVNQFLEMGFEIPQIQEAVEATQSYETHDLLLYLGSLGGKASLYTLLDISTLKGKIDYFYKILLYFFETEALKIGDLVILSGSESKVKESFDRTQYVWDDKMKHMLGKEFRVLLFDGDIIALPSPDGSQGGKWYFHRSVVHKLGNQIMLGK